MAANWSTCRKTGEIILSFDLYVMSCCIIEAQAIINYKRVTFKIRKSKYEVCYVKLDDHVWIWPALGTKLP